MEINEKTANNVRKISGLLTAYWKTQAIFSIVNLGLLEIINEGPLSLDKLKEKVSLPSKSFELILRAMIYLELVSFDEKTSTISITELGELLTDNHPYSMKHAVRVWATYHYQTWQYLTEALISGKEQFSKIFDESFFSWLGNHENEAKSYYAAMQVYALIDYYPLVPYFKFDENQIVVDVGGGQGGLTSLLAPLFPKTKFVLFDLEKPISFAKQNLELSRLDNVVFQQGDFFKRIPNAHHILMSRVIHDWEDQKALTILRNSYKSLFEGGHVYLIEHPLPKSMDDGWGALLNLNMLVITGSYERTEQEYIDLLVNAGFKNISIISHPETGMSIIKGVKN